MNYIEQGISILFENKINYQKIDQYSKREFNAKINNFDEFYERNKSINGISVITGSNGIGKSYLLEMLKEKYQLENKTVILIKLKDYNKLDKIKSTVLEESDIILFDGLDEINKDIMNDVLTYIFSIKDKKIMISSRKDYLHKKNLLDINYNIYEIKLLEDYKIDSILTENDLNKEKFKQIYNLLKTPRFLVHLIKVKDTLNNISQINKYDLLDLIVDKHLGILNERAIEKIETNIHKKILQALALVMMMTGKMNLTTEEFITFLSKINYLDVKSYILNKDIIESFLNNQILMNFGNLITFENKELMEFLAAKEIYENNFSNQELFNIVSINNGKEINSLWYNTLTYLVYKSNLYNELILTYVFNKFEEQENLLDFLLNVDFNFVDKDLTVRNIEKIIFQYTKLYQYMPFYGNLDNIAKILSCNYKECFIELIRILFNYKLDYILTDFDIIFVNNVLTCIHYLIENYDIKDTDLEKLKIYLSEKENYYMNSEHFNVRYLNIFLHLFDYEDIDNIIANNTIKTRLLSLFLHETKELNKLKNLDVPINRYILNCKNKFSDIVINEDIIVKFINANYDSIRVKNLLNSINDDNDIAGFIHFLNSNHEEKLWGKFDKKNITEILYNKIIKLFVEDSNNCNKEIREEIFFDRRKGDALENIISLCIKYNYIHLKDLNNSSFKSNYIVQYMRELIIKQFIINNRSVKEIYDKLEEKDSIFFVWKLDLDDNLRTELEEEINLYFPEKLLQYKKVLLEHKNKNYVKAESKLNKIYSAENIYYKIDNLYDFIKNEEYMKVVNTNIILKNTLRFIVNEIDKHIKSINISNLNINFKDEQTYTISYDYYLYSKAIYILFKSGYDINKYNDNNVILLNDIEDEIIPEYTKSNYEHLLTFAKEKESANYVKLYLFNIINKLKKYHSKELVNLIFSWIEYIEFKEYQINQLLSFIINNISLLNDSKIDKLKKFRENKICQDLLIELGIENEIIDRVNYIKQNLVFEGDLMTIEGNGNFEYSSGTYIAPLAKIGIKNKQYIFDLLIFAFDIYNNGNYFSFSKYVLEMVTTYINNNIDSNEINEVIEFIVIKEKNNNNRYLYEMCNNINLLKKPQCKQIGEVINEYNLIMHSPKQKTFTYDDLFNKVKDILEETVFDDILRMGFLEIFRNNDTLEIRPLKEESYQFIIGYELSRILHMKGFATKVIFETTSFDKKRGDIQLVSEGFIENIIIETKLTNNSDISNEESVKTYINNTLENYKNRFNSPKILFVLINQTLSKKTCEKRIKWIEQNNEKFVTPVLIDLKKCFNKNNKI